MALPLPEWVHLLLEVGSPVVVGFGTWKAALSQSAVSSEATKAAIVTVGKHEDRLGKLEASDIRRDEWERNMDARTMDTNSVVKETNNLVQRIAGRLERGL